MQRYTQVKNSDLYNKIEVILKGRGNGRETSVRALKAAGLNILSIDEL